MSREIFCLKRLVGSLAPAVAALSILSSSAKADDSRLTIYMYPASEAIDWSSPRSALESFSWQGVVEEVSQASGSESFTDDFGQKGSWPFGYRSTMGHTIAHVDCDLGNGQRFDKWASLSGQEYREVDMRNFKDEIGLGVLFYNYIDGFIIAGQENQLRLAFYTGERGSTSVHPRYMSFNIDSAAYTRLKAFEQDFESYHYTDGTPLETLEKMPAWDHLYFTTNMDPYDTYHQYLSTPAPAPGERPHVMVGGGCAPFGVALIREAGILSDDQGQLDPALKNDWQLRLTIAEALIGGATGHDGQPIKVADWDLLITDLGNVWSKPGLKSRPFTNFDPEKLWDTVGDTIDCLQGKPCTQRANDLLQSKFLNGRHVAVGPTEQHENTHPGINTAKIPLIGGAIDWTLSNAFEQDMVKQTLSNDIQGIQIDQ